jgi:hypothetical protein
VNPPRWANFLRFLGKTSGPESRAAGGRQSARLTPGLWKRCEHHEAGGLSAPISFASGASWVCHRGRAGAGRCGGADRVSPAGLASQPTLEGGKGVDDRRRLATAGRPPHGPQRHVKVPLEGVTRVRQASRAPQRRRADSTPRPSPPLGRRRNAAGLGETRTRYRALVIWRPGGGTTPDIGRSPRPYSTGVAARSDDERPSPGSRERSARRRLSPAPDRAPVRWG